MSYDELENAEVARADFVILMISAAIGITTGCGVVGFNLLVHTIQDHIVWQDVPKLAPFGSDTIMRIDPDYTLWRSVLLPPIAAGAAVAGLRELAGGFGGDPRSVVRRKPQKRKPQRMRPPPGTFNIVVPMPTSADATTRDAGQQMAQRMGSNASTSLGSFDAGEQAAPGIAQRPGRSRQSSSAATMASAAHVPHANGTGHQPQQAGHDRNASAAPPSQQAGFGSVDDTEQPPLAFAAPQQIVRSAVSALSTQHQGPAGSLAAALGFGEEARHKTQTALRPYIKTVAAAVGLGAGVSLGPEGPSAELGSANASNFRRFVPPGVRSASCGLARPPSVCPDTASLPRKCRACLMVGTSITRRVRDSGKFGQTPQQVALTCCAHAALVHGPACSRCWCRCRGRLWSPHVWRPVCGGDAAAQPSSAPRHAAAAANAGAEHQGQRIWLAGRR